MNSRYDLTLRPLIDEIPLHPVPVGHPELPPPIGPAILEGALQPLPVGTEPGAVAVGGATEERAIVFCNAKIIFILSDKQTS